MVKIIASFLLIFIALIALQVGWSVLTKQEKWNFTKFAIRGIIISTVTIAVMFAIVILF